MAQALLVTYSMLPVTLIIPKVDTSPKLVLGDSICSLLLTLQRTRMSAAEVAEKGVPDWSCWQTSYYYEVKASLKTKLIGRC